MSTHVDEFHEWLKRNLILTKIPPAPSPSPEDNSPFLHLRSSFVPLLALNRYFSDHLDPILHEVFDHRMPVLRDEILNNKRCYVRVFATLLVIGQPKLINACVRRPQLSDSHGPFDVLHNFPDYTVGNAIWEKFQQTQWQFFAHEFNGGENIIINDNVALPIVELGVLAAGGNGMVYKMTIRNEYDLLVSFQIHRVLHGFVKKLRHHRWMNAMDPKKSLEVMLLKSVKMSIHSIMNVMLTRGYEHQPIKTTL
jgi:hypothetical protein